MPRYLTDDQLAKRLRQQQVDRTVLDEAAKRLEQFDMQQLLQATNIIQALNSSGILTEEQLSLIEKAVMTVPLSRYSPARITSLAGRILSSEKYTKADVMSLAASVLQQDDDDA